MPNPSELARIEAEAAPEKTTVVLTSHQRNIIYNALRADQERFPNAFYAEERANLIMAISGSKVTLSADD